MHAKYYNDALVGNDKIKASFTCKGELIRMFYGNADYKQFLDFFHVGLKINDSRIIYLHNDINNFYTQEYIDNTNVLETTIFNAYFKTNIVQTDFVPINENVLIRNYKIENNNTYDLKINLLTHSKILTNLNNDTSGYVKNNTLIQYNHDFSVCTFANQELMAKQINGASNDFPSGSIGGKDYIGMSSDSAIGYDLEVLKPGEEKNITLYIYINRNSEKSIIKDIDSEIDRIKNLNVKELKNDTIKYWKRYINIHDVMFINSDNVNEKIKKIYNRSILLFDLLKNNDTGGISAGIEVDEDKTKCGRYSYCWPRDAVFITEALDIVGMKDEATKFYSNFCKITQYESGMWEQRFYTDGRLAPSWGYQIDETASVVFGVYSHYKYIKDINFLIENIDMCEKAIYFLEGYIDDLLEQKNQFQLSYDLWEEFEGISLYSISAIFGAFSAMIKIYDEVKDVFKDNKSKMKMINTQVEILENQTNRVREYCKNTFYDENKKAYIRNASDRKYDISALGTVVPFKMFNYKDKAVENTVERMNMTLRTFTGGYVRYEGDRYMGGYSPWPIATLWMAWYYLEAGKNSEALELFSFVTNSASNHGLLGEQVNNDTMKPSWVIGLTWSHAMYIIILNKLREKQLI